MKRPTLLFPILTALACASRTPSESDLPSIATTNWTQRTELFVEYAALVAGRETLFAVHLTDLDTFKPLEAAAPVLELARKGAAPLRFSAPSPARPGIYRVVATVPNPGPYRMTLRVGEPMDVHDLGVVTVHADAKTAAASAAEEGAAELTVSFLKEQQWATSFRTEPVAKRSLRASVRVPGEVRPRAGGEARVLSPVAGRVVIEGGFLAPGAPVRKGQVLARVAPQIAGLEDRASLELALAQAEAELLDARRQRERADRLLEAKAVPARRLEQARLEETLAQAKREAARKKLAQLEETLRSGGGGSAETHVILTSPISGVLLESRVTQGAAVERGQELFRVVDPTVVYIVGAVPEAEAPRLRKPTGVAVDVPGLGTTASIDLDRARLLTSGSAVDAPSRTVPMVYEVRNDGALLIGQAVGLVLFTDQVASTLAIPESALVDEGGRSVAFVQVGGESFARRLVEVGSRDRGYAQVLSGLDEGERLVTTGAYEVRLASLSGQIPAEGHVH